MPPMTSAEDVTRVREIVAAPHVRRDVKHMLPRQCGEFVRVRLPFPGLLRRLKLFHDSLDAGMEVGVIHLLQPSDPSVVI